MSAVPLPFASITPLLNVTVIGNDSPDVVFAEKWRQDALEAAGWIVVRVTWDDLRDPGPTIARIRRALSTRLS